MGKYDLQWTSNHIDRKPISLETKTNWRMEFAPLIDALAQADRRISKNEGEQWLNKEYVEKDIVKRYEDTYAVCFKWQMSLRLGLQQSNIRMVKLWKRWLRRSKADYSRASRLWAS